MKAMINDVFNSKDGAGLEELVDVDQWLRNFAVYAVLVLQASPTRR